MEITSSSTEETKKLAEKIAKKLNSKSVVALHGDLGSGKTTFTRFLVEALNIPSRVQSPTFVLVREYKGRNLKINHIDLYRLTSKDEVLDIGLDDFLKEDNTITIIEWPEIIEDILPKNTIKIYFEDMGEDKRKIKVENV